jgi:hypothetical protein
MGEIFDIFSVGLTTRPFSGGRERERSDRRARPLQQRVRRIVAESQVQAFLYFVEHGEENQWKGRMPKTIRTPIAIRKTPQYRTYGGYFRYF